MSEATVAASPHRDRASLRRGVLYNARQFDDGTWGGGMTGWRPRPEPSGTSPSCGRISPARTQRSRWSGGASRFVRDADAAQFVTVKPGTPVHVVEGASHSVKSDAPETLAGIIDQFVFKA